MCEVAFILLRYPCFTGHIIMRPAQKVYIYLCGRWKKDILLSVNVWVSLSAGVNVCVDNCFDLICMPVQGSSVLVLKDLRQRVRLITRTWHKDSRCPGVLAFGQTHINSGEGRRRLGPKGQWGCQLIRKLNWLKCLSVLPVCSIILRPPPLLGK